MSIIEEKKITVGESTLEVDLDIKTNPLRLEYLSFYKLYIIFAFS